MMGRRHASSSLLKKWLYLLYHMVKCFIWLTSLSSQHFSNMILSSLGMIPTFKYSIGWNQILNRQGQTLQGKRGRGGRGEWRGGADQQKEKIFCCTVQEESQRRHLKVHFPIPSTTKKVRCLFRHKKNIHRKNVEGEKTFTPAITPNQYCYSNLVLQSKE